MQQELVPVKLDGAQPPDGSACCGCCNARCGGLTVMGWVAAVGLLYPFLYLASVFSATGGGRHLGADLFSVCVAYGINAIVFGYLYWKYRDSVTVDMIVKIFAFTMFVGVLLAMIAEGALAYVASLVLLPAPVRDSAQPEIQGDDGSVSAQQHPSDWSELYNTSVPCDILYETFPIKPDTNATNANSMVPTVHHTAGFFVYLIFLGFIDAAMVEEAVKLIAARCRCCCNPCCVPGWRRTGYKNLRDPWSFLIYMLAAAAGFSTMENLAYLFANRPLMLHVLRPDCYDPVPVAATLSGLAGRVLLCYPLHLLCGALTGCQLIRRNLTPESLHWGWLLAPAVVTHGAYDSVLFCLAAYGGSGHTDSHSPTAEQMAIATTLQVVLGWVYLMVPALWLRRKLASANLAQIMTREAQVGLLAAQQMAYAGQ